MITIYELLSGWLFTDNGSTYRNAISAKPEYKLKWMETYCGTRHTMTLPKTIINFLFKNRFDIFILETENLCSMHTDFTSVVANLFLIIKELCYACKQKAMNLDG